MKKYFYIIVFLALTCINASAGHLLNPFIIEPGEYSQSTIITSVIWDHYETDHAADGSDRWAVTMNSSGDLILSWGDGWGEDVCGSNESYKTSMGFSQITGTPESYTMTDICGELSNCGAASDYCFANYPASTTAIYPVDVIAIGTSLYAWVRDNDLEIRRIYKSTDDGETWSSIANTEYDTGTGDLHPNMFCHFTQAANYDASDYVYMLGYVEGTSGTMYLWRVDKDLIEDRSNYEIFTGTPSSPSWSTSETGKQPVFILQDSETQRDCGAFQYNATYQKYFYTYFGDENLQQLRMYESANPYGPWYLVDSSDSWGGLSATTFGSIHPINEWTTGNGNIHWYTYDGNSVYDDFWMIRAVFNGYLQDFETDWTETDPNSHITVNSEFNISFSGLGKDETAYVYRDMGTGYFDDDFTHTFDFQITDANASADVCVWMVSNTLGDFYTLKEANEETIVVKIYNNDYRINIRESHNGTVYGSTIYYGSQNTRYYATVSLDKDGSTYGRVTLTLYSDYNRSTQVSSEYIDLHSSESYRYVYAVSSNQESKTFYRSGDVRNLHME